MVPFASSLSAIALEQQSLITTQNIQSHYGVMTEIDSIFEEIPSTKILYAVFVFNFYLNFKPIIKLH